MVQLPILFFGSFLFLKKKTRKKVKITKDTNTNTDIDNTYIDNFSVDEQDLNLSNIPDEMISDFDTHDEDISFRDDEEPDIIPSKVIESPAMTCDDFLNAIHIITSDNDIPINKIAINQTIIPVMSIALNELSRLSEFIDEDVAAPIMIEAALNELVPVCGWEYDSENYEFVYDNDKTVTSTIGREVIYGLMRISSDLIEEFNESQSKNSEVLENG